MDWTNPFIIGPLCMGAGVFVGMLLMRLLDSKGDDAQALAALRDEFDDYRTNVNEHFEQTSELFQGMTEKYRDVYNHLAAGAQQFGNSEASPPRLEIVQPAAQLEAEAASDEPVQVVEAEATSQLDETGDAPATEAKDASGDEAQDQAAVASQATQAAPGDDSSAPFDPSALDESELADLVEAEAEPAAADSASDAGDEEEERLRGAQNTFRDMPQPDNEEVAVSSVNGVTQPHGREERRKEPATQS